MSSNQIATLSMRVVGLALVVTGVVLAVVVAPVFVSLAGAGVACLLKKAL